MRFTDLPTLGVGLAADVASIKPDFRRFVGDTDLPIDYLNVGGHYVQRRRIHHYIDDVVNSGLPMVFHPINFNIGTADTEPEEYLEGVRSIVDYIGARWVGQDIGLWMYAGNYLGPFLLPVVLDERSVNEVAEKVATLRDALGVPVAIENPPVCFSLEHMHMLDFMREVAVRADCGLVLDIGHLIGYQQGTGRAVREMPVDEFPFERIVEVHLAGLQFSHVGDDTAIIDQHSYPIHDLCWEFFRDFAPRMVNLKGLTLEQEYCETESVATHLVRARELCKELGVFEHANRV